VPHRDLPQCNPDAHADRASLLHNLKPQDPPSDRIITTIRNRPLPVPANNACSTSA